MKRALLLALLFALSYPAFAADGPSLSLLPWDDSISRDVRGGVRSALDKEKAELQKQKNAKDRPFVYVFTNEGIEFVDGKPVSYVTIQRCLEDKMVSERWRYTLEKSGAEYAIVDRKKLSEIDDAYPRSIEKASAARTAAAFQFEHDLLKLTGEAGGRISVRRIGNQADGILWVGKGRVTLTPVSDQEALFYEKTIDKRSIDSEIEALEFDFQPGDESILRAFGVARDGSGGAAGGGAEGSQGELLKQMVSKLEISDENRYTPGAYAFPPRPEYQGTFSVRIRTKDLGWIYYRFASQPELPQFQVMVAKEGANLSVSRDTRAANDKIISYYPGPQLRAMPRQQMERVRGLRDAAPLRYEAMLDLAPDRFSAQVDVDLQLLVDARELYFGLGGNPSVRSVTQEGSGDLVVVPVGGFEGTANYYRVVLPQETPAGTILRMRVSFDSPKLVRMVSDGFWYVERGAFLPFMGTLDDAAAVRFIVRTKDPYTHISIGSKQSEEVVGGYRYTEWGADRMMNFPTVIVGKYYKPIVQDADGVRITGYQTSTGMGDGSMDQDAMRPQVIQAADSMRLFTKLYGLPYPFKDLKLVGTPAQFMSAQSPTSIIYVGAGVMMKEAELMTWGREMFGPNFDPMWVRAVTAHENAHQWWGGRVSSINFGSYWFVETFSEISAHWYLEAIKDDAGVRSSLNYWRTSGMARDRLGPVAQPIRAPMLYYTKGPFVVNMLRHYYSEDKLLSFLRTTMQTYDGDLIATADLRVVANKVFGENMDWWFDQYVEGMGVPEVAYKFNDATPAEDGKGWIITGRLEQVVKWDGKILDGKYFTKMLVPMTVETSAGPVQVKEYMDSATKDLRIRVEAKPKGAPKIQDQLVWLTTRAL